MFVLKAGVNEEGHGLYERRGSLRTDVVGDLVETQHRRVPASHHVYVLELVDLEIRYKYTIVGELGYVYIYVYGYT